MARADILVINPNSNPAVTAGLDAALGTLRLADGPSIRCATLSEGPFGIEKKDVEQVTPPLRRLVEQDNAADAFVIACFSDAAMVVSDNLRSGTPPRPRSAGTRKAGRHLRPEAFGCSRSRWSRSEARSRRRQKTSSPGNMNP
jgi:hypothetical protein